MQFSLADYLGWSVFLSEMVLNRIRQPGQGFAVKDRYSYRAIWVVIMVAIVAGYFAAGRFPAARIASRTVLYPPGLAIFAGGLILRWYSIFHLGRFFTVKIAIADDHRVIDTGPYRWIRHPSYTGAIAQFIGIALCLGNSISFVLIVAPVVTVFALRIREEEQALAQALGDGYRSYMRRTWRLVPLVY